MSAAPSSIAGDTIRPAKKIEHRKTMSSRRFPPPWSITELEACLVVDGAGQKLAYVYFEEARPATVVVDAKRQQSDVRLI